MNSEKFDEWVVDVHCVLFHVDKKDLDDTHKVGVDQL